MLVSLSFSNILDRMSIENLTGSGSVALKIFHNLSNTVFLTSVSDSHCSSTEHVISSVSRFVMRIYIVAINIHAQSAISILFLKILSRATINTIQPNFLRVSRVSFCISSVRPQLSFTHLNFKDSQILQYLSKNEKINPKLAIKSLHDWTTSESSGNSLITSLRQVKKSSILSQLLPFKNSVIFTLAPIDFF